MEGWQFPVTDEDFIEVCADFLLPMRACKGEGVQAWRGAGEDRGW